MFFSCGYFVRHNFSTRYLLNVSVDGIYFTSTAITLHAFYPEALFNAGHCDHFKKPKKPSSKIPPSKTVALV